MAITKRLTELMGGTIAVHVRMASKPGADARAVRVPVRAANGDVLAVDEQPDCARGEHTTNLHAKVR